MRYHFKLPKYHHISFVLLFVLNLLPSWLAAWQPHMQQDRHMTQVKPQLVVFTFLCEVNNTDITCS